MRESGLSLTKPNAHSHSQVVMSEDNGSSLSDKIIKKEEKEEEEEVKAGDLESGGEGMEWHSDGSKGEFTMLLSFKGKGDLYKRAYHSLTKFLFFPLNSKNLTLTLSSFLPFVFFNCIIFCLLRYCTSHLNNFLFLLFTITFSPLFLLLNFPNFLSSTFFLDFPCTCITFCYRH